MSKLALVCPTALADKVQQLVVHLNARYLPTADLDDRERLARLHALQATLRTLYTMLPVIPRQDDFVLAEIELQLQRMWPAMPPVVSCWKTERMCTISFVFSLSPGAG